MIKRQMPTHPIPLLDSSDISYEKRSFDFWSLSSNITIKIWLSCLSGTNLEYFLFPNTQSLLFLKNDSPVLY